MRKVIIALLVVISVLFCMAACKEEQSHIANENDTVEENGENKDTTVHPTTKGIQQDPNKTPLDPNLIENIKVDMYAFEVYEYLGNPNVYIPSQRSSAPIISYAYYELSDESVLEIEYEYVLGQSKEETNGELPMRIVKIDYLTLEEYVPLKEEYGTDEHTIFG